MQFILERSNTDSSSYSSGSSPSSNSCSEYINNDEIKYNEKTKLKLRKRSKRFSKALKHRRIKKAISATSKHVKLEEKQELTDSSCESSVEEATQILFNNLVSENKELQRKADILVKELLLLNGLLPLAGLQALFLPEVCEESI